MIVGNGTIKRPCRHAMRTMSVTQAAALSPIQRRRARLRQGVQDRRTARRRWRQLFERGHAQRISLYRAARLGLSLQDARRRPPANSQLRAARRHGRPARRADARDGALGRSADAADAVRLPAQQIVRSLQPFSLARLRHHLARRARGAIDRRASGQPRPAHRA